MIGLAFFALYSVAPVWWLVVAATKPRGPLPDQRPVVRRRQPHREPPAALHLPGHGTTPGGWPTPCSTPGRARSGSRSSRLPRGTGSRSTTYRGRGRTMGLVIGSFLIPGALLTDPVVPALIRLGIFDTVWAMIVPSCSRPFSVYLAKVYAEAAVPSELIEAARIDGAGEYRSSFSRPAAHDHGGRHDLPAALRRIVELLLSAPCIPARDRQVAGHAGPLLLASARRRLPVGPHRDGHPGALVATIPMVSSWSPCSVTGVPAWPWAASNSQLTLGLSVGPARKMRGDGNRRVGGDRAARRVRAAHRRGPLQDPCLLDSG